MALRAPQQIPFDLPARSALARDDFLVTQSNRDAVAWIDRWPEWPAPLLIISGPAASGKSHLAAVWRERAKAEAIRPEMLVSRSAEQICAAGPHILIDGLDPWLGEREAEATLFHIYNILKEEKRSMMVTMRMTATEVPFIVPDLASRFRAAPLAEIKPPDDMLLGSVLIKLFADRQLSATSDVISYILPRMERSFDAARDIVAKTDALALARKRKITVPLLRDVLTAMQGDGD